MILAKTGGNLNHIADSHCAPLYPLPASFPQHLYLPHIYFIVRSVSFLKMINISFIRVTGKENAINFTYNEYTYDVLDYLFQSRYAEDENQWNQCCPASCRRHVRYLLNSNQGKMLNVVE